MLKCSRLNNFLSIFPDKTIRQIVLLLLLGNVSVHAQAQYQNPKTTISNSQEAPAKWLQVSELPIRVSEATENKKPSGLIDKTIDWYQKKSVQSDFQIHGFIGQSYILSSHNNVFGHSTSGAGGSFGLTEAGLNASFRPLPKLLISAQVLSRRAGEGSSGMPRLDFAFLDYRLYSHEANQFGIRAGRLKNPFGFYNDTRDVPFTRPSILLPQSIYFDRTRNLALSGDSVQLYADVGHSRWGTFSTQVGLLFPIVSDRDTERAVLVFPNMHGHLTRDVSYIGRGIYETNDKRIRLGVSGIWLDSNYDPPVGEKILGLPITSGSLQFSPVYFSAQYNAERWSLTGEYAIRHFAYSGFHHNTIDTTNFFGESFYVQGEYRITPKLETFIRYDVMFTDRSDKNGKIWASKDSDRLKGFEHSRYAKDFTVGLRWNVTPEFMVRAEYHHVNGTGWISRLDNPLLNQTEKNWDLFAIQASYRF